jgi:hypothetical protein
MDVFLLVAIVVSIRNEGLEGLHVAGEIGHLEAACVEDGEWNAFLDDLAGVVGDRAAVAGLGEVALEDAVNERALADASAAGDEDVGMAALANGLVEGFLGQAADVEVVQGRDLRRWERTSITGCCRDVVKGLSIVAAVR